jgi:hypothetical protein
MATIMTNQQMLELLRDPKRGTSKSIWGTLGMWWQDDAFLDAIQFVDEICDPAMAAIRERDRDTILVLCDQVEEQFGGHEVVTLTRQAVAITPTR